MKEDRKPVHTNREKSVVTGRNDVGEGDSGSCSAAVQCEYEYIITEMWECVKCGDIETTQKNELFK